MACFPEEVNVVGKHTLDLLALAAETKDGTKSLSPGPKILLGRIQQVKSPPFPFACKTNASASALVAEYESLCCESIKQMRQ